MHLYDRMIQVIPEQAAGILVQVANQSNASIESMQQALSSIGPTAASAGYSMQDTAKAR